MSPEKTQNNQSVSHRKTRTGFVTSDKMDKTVVVSIERRILHPRFRKYVRRHKKVKAHDEKNTCTIGDWVQIIETRPLSKDKCWRVQKVLRKSAEAGSL